MARRQDRKKGKRKEATGVRPIHRMTKQDVAAVKREIIKIELRGLEPSPARIVDVARDPKNPMHPFFQWNDTEAARRYRLDQARELIGMIRIKIRDVPQPVREWVGVKLEKSETKYVRRTVVAQDLTMQAERSERLWHVAEAAAREAMSVGLHEKEERWASLCEIVFAEAIA